MKSLSLRLLLAVLFSTLPLTLRAGPGSVDTTFAVGEQLGGQIYRVIQQPDGHVAVLYYTSNSPANPNTANSTTISQLDANGARVAAFGSGGYATPLTGSPTVMAVQPADGKIVYAGRRPDTAPLTPVGRLNADGSPDTNFQFGAFQTASGAGDVYALALQADGKILVGGFFSEYNGAARNGLARLNADGSLDDAFVPPSTSGPLLTNVLAVAAQADGKVLVAGNFLASGQTQGGVVRLNADGSLDGSFAFVLLDSSALSSRVPVSLAVQPDGAILVAGYFQSINGARTYYMSRLLANGTVDASFAPIFEAAPASIAVQADGKIIVGGGFTSVAVGDSTSNGVARLNADGSKDSTFDVGSGALSSGSSTPSVNSVSLQKDGKVLVGGAFASFNGSGMQNVARLLVTDAPTPPEGALTVPGTSNIWLAGAAPGATASSGQDNLTNATPFLVPGIALTAGQILTFSATGNVSNDPANPVTVGPDGGPYLGFTLYKHEKENGIADLTAPINSLVGVFLDDSTPNPLTAPDGYDLSVPPGTEYTLIAPALRKPFFIGDGLTTDGTVQQIRVPSGATRLFLGSLDPSDQENNPGSFFVTVNGGTPAPANNAPVLAITDSTVSAASNATGTSAIPGEKVTYGFTVRNTSDFDAANVKAVATLNGAKFKTVSDSAAVSGASATWSLGTLAAHSSRTLTATAKIAGSAPLNGNITFKVDPVTTDTPSAALPGALTLTTKVLPPYQVSVSYNSNVSPGDTLRLTLSARNVSKSAISGLSASALLPAGVKFLSITDDQGNALAIKPNAGVLTAPLPTIAAGGSSMLTVSLQINFDTASGSTLTLSGLKIALGDLVFTQPDINITLGAAPAANPPSLAVGKYSTDADTLNTIFAFKPEAADVLQALSGLPLKTNGVVDPTVVAKLALLLNPTLGGYSDASDPTAPNYAVGVASAKAPAPYLTFAVIATNNGTGDVSGVTVTDPLPDGFAYDPAAAQAPGNPLAPPYALALVDGKPTKDATYQLGSDGRSLKLKIGKLKAGQSGLLVYQVQLTATIAQAGTVLSAPNPTLTAKELSTPLTSGLDLKYLLTGPAHAVSEVTTPAGNFGKLAAFDVFYHNDGGKTAKDLKVLVKQPANAQPYSARFLDNNRNVLNQSPPGQFIEDALDANGNKVFHLGKVKPNGFGYVRITYTPVAGTTPSAIHPVSTISPDSFGATTNAVDHTGPVARGAFHPRAGGVAGPVSGSSAGTYIPDDPRYARFALYEHAPFAVPAGQTYEVTFSAMNLSDKLIEASALQVSIPPDTDFVSFTGAGSSFGVHQGGVTSPGGAVVSFSGINPHSAVGAVLTLRARTGSAGKTIVHSFAEFDPVLADFYLVTANVTQTYVLKPNDSLRLKASEIVGNAVAPYGATAASVAATATKLAANPDLGTTTLVNAGVVSFQGGGVLIPLGSLNGVPQLVAAGAGNLVAAGAGNLVAAGAGNLVAAGAGNVISLNGLSGLAILNGLIGNDGTGVVATHQANLFNGGGNNLISQDGSGLISQDGSGLSVKDLSQVVSNDGGSFAAGLSNSAALISQDGSGIVSHDAAGIVAAGAGNLVAAGAGNLVAAGAGNLVAAGAGNFTSRAQPGAPLTRGYHPRALAAGQPAQGSPANSVVIHPTDDGLVIVGGGKVGQ